MPETRKRGRPKGSVNKASAIRTERAERSGMMPCEVMLEAMRYLRGLATRHASTGQNPDENKMLKYLERAAQIAKDVAPYYHPRLMSTTISSNPDKPVAMRLEVAFV